MSNPDNITILIHGGCGRVHPTPLSPTKEKEYADKLREALLAGYHLLENGASAVQSIEAAIRVLEDSPLFNAGRGSVYSNDEVIELDAAIMDGASHKAGSVAGVRTIKNPISAARTIMENSDHVMMTGAGAEKFAATKKLEIVDPSYFKTEDRWNQILQLKKNSLSPSGDFSLTTKFGTVGAVALDSNGNLAAGTSTGGMLNKKFGRVGDSPIIGAGTYANRICAVSGTGHGEFFIRYTVARDIAALMEYQGLSVTDAAHEVIKNKVEKAGGLGGVIALDSKGNIATPFTTEGMFWAYIKADGTTEINVCNIIIE
jgi:beta-aspartyl-peptidase (threonine type)